MTILLLIVGAGLIFWLQNKIYQRYWETGLEADIRFQAHPAVEGETAELTETVTNRKLLPLPALTVKFQFQRNLRFENMENASVSDRCYRSDVFSVLFYQKVVRTLNILCEKRGYYTIENMDLIATNLLMTNELVTAKEQFTQLYVYPRTIATKQLALLSRRITGEAVRRQYLYPDPFAFRGIREYQISDPMNTINWNASARSDGLMVNTYDTTSSQEVVFVLDMEDETVWHYDALHEEGIRLVASLAQDCIEDGSPVSFFCNGRDVISGEDVYIRAGTGKQQQNNLMEALARIDIVEQEVTKVGTLAQDVLEQTQNQAVLVFLSSCQKESTVEAFEKLAMRCPGAFWIMPLHPDLECRISSTGQYEVVLWEVPYES